MKQPLQGAMAMSTFSWRALLFAVHLYEASAYARSRHMKCPMDYEVPLSSGRPSNMHLKSVANFLEPKVQDTWWDEEHVQQYYQPSNAFRIAPSKIAGCGVFAAREIKAGEKVGIVWVKDPKSASMGAWGDLMPRHFTPWFGRAVNHCKHSNSHLVQDEDGTVWTVATRDVTEGEEVTGNYNEAAQQFPHLVEPAPAGWTC